MSRTAAPRQRGIRSSSWSTTTRSSISLRIAHSRGPAVSATTVAPGSWPTAVWPCCPRAQRWASPTRRSGRGRPRASRPRPASRRSGPKRSRRSAALPTAPPSSRSGTAAPTSSRISRACGTPAGTQSCGPFGIGAWFRAAVRSQRCGPPAPWGRRASGPRPGRPWSVWPGARLSFCRPAAAPEGARRSGSGVCGSGTTGSSFKKVSAEHKEHRVPLFDTFNYHWRAVLIVIGAKVIETSTFFLFATFTISYLIERGFARAQALNIILIAAVLAVPVMLYFGALSDRIGRKRLFMLGTVAIIVYILPYFWLLDQGSGLIATLAMVLGFSVIWSSYGAMIGTF